MKNNQSSQDSAAIESTAEKNKEYLGPVRRESYLTKREMVNTVPLTSDTESPTEKKDGVARALFGNADGKSGLANTMKSPRQCEPIQKAG